MAIEFFEVLDKLTFFIRPPSAKRGFPNCAAVFAEICHDPPEPRRTGRSFVVLCRLTPAVWLLWAFNATVVLFAAWSMLYHWAWKQGNMEQPWIGEFTCKMVLAVSVAVVFVGKLVFSTLWEVSVSLSERCRESARRPEGTP